MFCIKSLLLLFCILIKWRNLNALIFPPKLMIDGEHGQFHQRPPSIFIVKMNNPIEDDQLLSSEKLASGGLLDEPAKETNDENWESKNKNRYQMWRVNGHNSNKKIIFSRPLMWQSHRSFPSICLAGPSMFRSCCARIREMSNDTEPMPQFCFFGRCCKNVSGNTSSLANTSPIEKPNSIPFPSPPPRPPIFPSVSDSSIALPSEQLSTDAFPTPSLTESPSSETPSNQSFPQNPTKVPIKPPPRTMPLLPESKKVRLNEKKPNFKSGNKNGENEIEALASSASKLQKMSGKGKNFLSREETTDKREKSGESDSDEGSIDDSLRFDGDGFASEETDDLRNKSGTTSQPKTGSSSYEANYSELEDPVSVVDKSSEPLEIDDDVSKYSEESVEEISKHIKPYRKSQTKQRTQITKKDPIVTLKPKNNINDTKSSINTIVTSNSSTITDTPAVTKDQTSTAVKSTKDNQTILTKSSNLSVTTSTLPAIKAKLNSNSSSKVDSKESKNSCPRNRGGPNCSIDITDTISGYGYYVYLHKRPLSRSDSIRECVNRNMSLAFLTNHNEDKLLRRLVTSNATYWIGLAKEMLKGELKSRFRWEDGSDAGIYITRYVVLDNEGQEKGKTKEDAPLTSCTLKLLNGKMKVECVVGQTQQLAHPICMYRPPTLMQQSDNTAITNDK